MKRQKFLWFQLAALAGAGLAVLLVLETLLTYRYSATRLARAEGLVQAVEEVSALEHRLSRERVDTRNGLEQILQQVVDERSEEIAWVSVIDANGQVQVSSSATAPAPVFASDRIHAALERGENPSLVQNIAQGQILIALVPLKRQLLPRSGSELPFDWRLVEIAIYLRAPQGILHPLHRNLLVTALVSFVLLAAMVVFLVRLKTYVRGRMLEEQLELARTVQQQLLPARPRLTLSNSPGNACPLTWWAEIFTTCSIPREERLRWFWPTFPARVCLLLCEWEWYTGPSVAFPEPGKARVWARWPGP